MKCPKCEEGILTKIKLKLNNSSGVICEFCGNIWLNNENINEFSGHTINSLSNNGNLEYTFDDFEIDEDTKSIRYPTYK